MKKLLSYGFYVFTIIVLVSAQVNANFSTEFLNYSLAAECVDSLKQVGFDEDNASKMKSTYTTTKAKEIKLFPTVILNSATVLITDFRNDMEVDIVDASGRILKVICIDAPRTTLQLGDLIAGTYWLRCIKPSGVEMHFFIKK